MSELSEQLERLAGGRAITEAAIHFEAKSAKLEARVHELENTPWFKLADEAEARAKKAEAALKFVQDVAEEELPHARVGTGAEVALRHIARRARETLAK